MRNASLSRALLPLLAAAALLGAAAPAAAACPADWNGDSVVDQTDVTLFAAAWNLCPDADFNRDGDITVQDLYDFQSAWAGDECAADLDRDCQVNGDLDDLNGFIAIWQKCISTDIDCNADNAFDSADFAQFLAGWCAVAGC